MSAPSSAIAPQRVPSDEHPGAAAAPRRPGRAGRAFHFVALAVGIALIVWLLDRIGWSYLASCLARVGAGGVILVALLAAGESICDALSLRAATRDHIGRKRAVLINQAGALVNQFLPAEAGEVWKATLLSAHAGDTGVPATLIWNYAFKLTRPIAAFTFALLAWAWAAPDRASIAGLVVLASALSIAPYLALRWLLRHGLATLATGGLSRLPLIGRRIGPRWIDRARQIDRHVRSFAWESPRAYARVLAWQLAARACSLLCATAALHLLAGFSLPLVALVYAASNVLSYVLLLLPTRVGATEGTTYLLFHLLGLEAGVGLVYAVLIRVVRLAGATPGLLSFVVHHPPRPR
jgi:hypothetical protein